MTTNAAGKSLLATLSEYIGILDAFREASAVAYKEKRISGPVQKVRAAARKMFKAQSKFVFDELARNKKIVEEAKRTLVDWDEEDIERLLDEAFAETVDEFVEALQDAMRTAMERAAEDASQSVGVDLTIDFTADRTEAVAYLEAHGAAYVTRINETTRSTIRSIVTAGVADAQSYGEVAKELRTAFASMSRYRARLIAVVEMGNAYEHATQHIAHTVQSAGIDLEKYWANVGDENVTDGCLENTSAGWIPLTQNFPSGHERPLRFPGCRCTALYRQAKGVG